MKALGIAVMSTVLLVATSCGAAGRASTQPASPSSSTPSRSAASTSAPASDGSSASAPASGAARLAAGTIKISYAQPVAATAALWMAQDNGTFKRYGLKTEVVRIAPPADIQAMVGGSTHFAFGGTGAMAAAAGGANLKFLAVTTGVYLQTLWGNPSIQKASDLAGKSVGATTKGGPSDFALHTILKRAGVDASKVNILYLRDDNANLAALQSGQIPAAILTSPNSLLARQAGFHLILDMVPLKIPTVTQGIFVRADWAQQNQDAVSNFLKGYLETVKIDKTDATAAKATITKWTQITDQAMVDESYQSTLGGLSSYPLARDAQFQNVIDLTDDQAMKSHKPSDFYDNSYLQKLDGFMHSLYPDGSPPD